jgi:hypothetical protein
MPAGLVARNRRAFFCYFVKNIHMKKLLLFSLVSLLVFGCAKYPDGGLHAFMKKNIMGTWKLNGYYLNNFDYSDTILIQNLQETFNEGGVFNRNYIDNNGVYHTYGGGWDVAAEKSVLKVFSDSTYQITPSASVITKNFTIDRLTKKDLWYSFEAGSGKHQLRFSKIK